MENQKSARGGARPGSGRKSAKDKKVTISFRVPEKTKDRIQRLREEGYDVNKGLEEAVSKWEFIHSI